MKNPLSWLFRTDAERREPELRETLFGDLPANQWPAAAAPHRDAEPWRWFVQAREATQRGDLAGAEVALRQVLNHPNLESRHYLQAWHALRAQGVEPPPAKAKRVLGVVVEVALPGGLDVVAAYADGSARYLNHSGKVIVWERPDRTLDRLVGELLAAGKAVTDAIGPWEGQRPSKPLGDTARINFLTPSGLHFGEAPMGLLWSDALAQPVLAAAQDLMVALMEKSEPGSIGETYRPLGGVV